MRNTLEKLYEGRKVYHGELHDHSASGGTSDGSCPLSEWPAKMKSLGMDFAAILDHRQVRHMYLPAWEDGLFIPGTEPGTAIEDGKAENNGMHYNIGMNSQSFSRLSRSTVSPAGPRDISAIRASQESGSAS